MPSETIGTENPQLRADASDSAQMEARLLDLLRCPKCGGPVESGQAGDFDQVACRDCGASYPRISGIWRMLTPDRQQAHQAFLSGYVDLRKREGWVRDERYYLSLPMVPPADSAEGIWQIRRRSLAVLYGLVGNGDGRWALDLGAGCGWLSRYLTAHGYNTVATDLNPEGMDGLQGVELYMQHDHTWIGRVQASMDELPLADSSFSLSTVSAAVHYAPLGRTLAEVARVLQPGGMFVITDSPVYKDVASGRAMAAEQRERAQGLLGKPPAALPGGEGYLVEKELLDAMAASGFRPRLIYNESVPGRVRSLVRGHLAPAQREHARFPVVIGVRV